MKLNEISNDPRARSARKRVGRGSGSGLGKTAGRGQKGQKSRSGVSLAGFEGGQMPLYRRLPKRGFNNVFRKEYREIDLARLQKAIDAGRLDAAQTIDAAALVRAGLVKSPKDGIRLLANGALNAKVTIEVAGASKAAIAAVEQAGGRVVVLSSRAGTAEAAGGETGADA